MVLRENMRATLASVFFPLKSENMKNIFVGFAWVLRVS